MASQVRTRFAPSPTGYLHVGGARTALYNYLFARGRGGTFILRIEDTDQKRSSEEHTQAILDSMTWLGLTWDEGPYFQSSRLDLYRAAAEKLLAAGLAYHEDDPEKGRATKMRMPKRIIKVPDLIHGEVEFDGSLADDFVIMKSDGFPTYNFACVVDDVDLRITHVIRGDEHLSNMPRQLVIYEALELEPPKFAHIPMILGQDGSKLSKRHGATSVGEYTEKGFLPEALVNFVALLGWSPGDGREIMSLDEMVESFSIERARAVSSRFDNDKLLWMNGQYLMGLPMERLAGEMRDYMTRKGIDLSSRDDRWLDHFARAYRERIKTLEDLLAASRFLFSETVEYDQAAVDKVLRKEGAMGLLRTGFAMLSVEAEWDPPKLEDAFKRFCEETKTGFGKIAQPIRVAVTGSTVSPPLFETLVLVGRDRSLARIDETLKRFSQASA
jgi:glutamyl-tRNA synthetase